MQSPFGAYRGGYNAMPEGYMDAWLSVGKNYADAITNVAGTIAGGVTASRDAKILQEQGRQSAPTNMSQYQQLAQATGQQVDPTILQRYQGLGEMSGPQIQQFNKDIQAAQQQAIALANIQRQQQQFQLQQQAAQRAMQQQALQQQGSYIDQMLNSRSMPSLNLPQDGGGINPILFPSYGR